MATNSLTPVQEHLAAICEEAGLGVMADILDVVLDRESLREDQVLALGSADIDVMYELWVGPAVDRCESYIATSDSLRESGL